MECNRPFDTNQLDLAPGEHNVTVFITDVFNQGADVVVSFTIPPPGTY